MSLYSVETHGWVFRLTPAQTPFIENKTGHLQRTPPKPACTSDRRCSVLFQGSSLPEHFSPLKNIRALLCVVSDWGFPFSSVQVIPVQISSAWFPLIQFASPGNGSHCWQEALVNPPPVVVWLARCYTISITCRETGKRERVCVCVHVCVERKT